jgi:hypothetical protein
VKYAFGQKEGTMTEVNEISMAEVLGTPLTPEQRRHREEYRNSTVMFRGSERKRGSFLYAQEPLPEKLELSWSGFTEEEKTRASELARPFNEKYHDGSDNSLSMHTQGMDENGFIFTVDEDFTDDVLATVHEKDLAAYLAKEL